MTVKPNPKVTCKYCKGKGYVQVGAVRIPCDHTTKESGAGVEELRKEVEKIIRLYLRQEFFGRYEEWIIEYESMRNEIEALVSQAVATARKEEIKAGQVQILRDLLKEVEKKKYRIGGMEGIVVVKHGDLKDLINQMIKEIETNEA